MALEAYRRKRDFSRTSEPAGARAGSAGSRYVIQKHDATRLHYDFRLEFDGVLKSWAIPKGIPLVHGEKRLAVQVEDHPLDYAAFEGTISAGQYGGGTVMVWDRGIFEAIEPDPAESLAKGKLSVRLRGAKLDGEWHLVRLREKDQWLLICATEQHKLVGPRADDMSAASGRTMRQIAASARKTKRAPDFVEPMKARLVDTLPGAGDWIYEVKFDGYRALGICNSGRARLVSRNEKDLSGKFPEIVDALARLGVAGSILDGEVVAADEQGRTSFQLLQQAELSRNRPAVAYYVFDLPWHAGEDIRDLPLTERKSRLRLVVPENDPVLRFSGSLEGDPKLLLAEAGRLGLEGLIAKHRASTYESGRRSGAWIKLKLVKEQEFVIGGYTEPSGSRTHFGALIVGVYEKKKLRFAAKVGSGYTEKELGALHRKLDSLATTGCPFVDLPQSRDTRWGQAITAAMMGRCHWVRPELVCQVRFAEWTGEGHLRQPVYLGLRNDKNPHEVLRESP